ncbi:MAG: hypothetical protein ACT4P1_14240 [Sporichthyaceae bacterium]
MLPKPLAVRRHPSELVMLALAVVIVVGLTVVAMSRLTTDTLQRTCSGEVGVSVATATSDC